MSGEAEADKPLLIQVFRYLLQNLDPLIVDFDQVVIGGEDGGNLLLHLYIREIPLNSLNEIQVSTLTSACASHAVGSQLPDMLHA